MRKTVGYMITWTTYGTWLQGDKRGYVRDGETLGENAYMEEANRNAMGKNEVRLNKNEKVIVEAAINEAAKRFEQKISAIAVYSNHVHIAAEYAEVPINIAAGYYKNYARAALSKNGRKGKVWTVGYDVRYCFSNEEYLGRVKYIQKHDK